MLHLSIQLQALPNKSLNDFCGMYPHLKDHGHRHISVDYKVPNESLQVLVDRFRQDETEDSSSMRGDQAYILEVLHQLPRRGKTNFRQEAIVQFRTSGRCAKQPVGFSALYYSREFLVLFAESSTGNVEMPEPLPYLPS